MANQTQRPRFYEGQYLGADDLATLVDYVRSSDARHALGAHTWGIAAGLHLTEKPAPGAPDRVEITLQPGFAWDGLGRLIVNPRPTRLREDLFAAIAHVPALDDQPGGKGRLVPIWLQYDETAARNPGPGFETCATDEAFSRIGEMFRFEIGQRTDAEQRASITIGTTTIDATRALQAYYQDPANSVPPEQLAPIIDDASAPHQQWPSARRPPLWLIPIGYARWVARDQALGYFAKRDLDPADKAASKIRAFRRYIGTVAEYIESADAAIVLHRRGTPRNGNHLFAKLLPADAKRALQDLVWVQGNLRVIGDARIAGGQCHFLNADGEDEKTALYLSRAGDNPAVPADGNRELRVAIGPAAQTTNRLIVGSQQPGPPVTVAPHLVVVSSGRTGIGTRDPATSLEVVGNWSNGEGAIRVTGDQPAIRFEPGEPAGKQSWVAHVTDTPKGNFRIAYKDGASWKGLIHANPKTARVGVVADDPRNPLGVRAAGQAQDLVSFEDPGGVTKWHISQKTADGATDGLSIVETPAGDGEGRLFIKTGGNVGMGTVAPSGRLSIKSPNPAQGTLNFFTGTTDVEYDGGADGLFIFTHAGGGVTSFQQTQVGVGTANPRAPLGVRAAATDFQDVLAIEDAGGTLRWQVLRGTGPGAGLNFRETQAPASRLMLKEGGNVGIGTPNPTEALHVAGNFVRVDGPGNQRALVGAEVADAVTFGTRSAAVEYADMRRLNLPWDTSDPDAWLTVYCNSVNELSDVNAKTDIESIGGALDRVMQLRGVSYRWKDQGKDRPRPVRLGLIAQEVREVVPEAVSPSNRGAAIQYSAIVPLLVEAIKELKQEVETLRGEVARLSAKTPPPAARAAKKPRK